MNQKGELYQKYYNQLEALKLERLDMVDVWDDSRNAQQDEKIRMVARFVKDLRGELVDMAEAVLNSSNESQMRMVIAIRLRRNGIYLIDINENLQKFLKEGYDFIKEFVKEEDTQKT